MTISTRGPTPAGRYDPLAPFGYSTTYSFPNGGYRIAAPGTGDPAVGPGRAGSLREDRTYTRLQFSVDIVNWDTSHSQAVGLLARVTDPGLLTTDGYALTYSTVDRTIDLSRMDNEYLTRLASAPIPANAAKSPHLVFVGVGSNLAGEILDDLNLAVPLASVRAGTRVTTTDSTGCSSSIPATAPTAPAPLAVILVCASLLPLGRWRANQ